MPQVLVVIVNWNGGRWLGRCLQALRAQRFADFAAVVVDNASEDGSAAIVETLDDPRFSLLRLESNLGFATASNRGAAQQPGTPFVALLNPDAFPAPDWLDALLEAARAHPGAAAFGAHLVDAERPTISDGTGDRYHISGRAWRRDHGQPLDRSHSEPGEVFAPCAAAALYRREAWTAAGGLDEDYFCYMEDVDLAFRLRLMGWQCRHVPAAVCLHVGSAITGQRSDFSVYHGQRNLVWTFVKNMPPALLLLLGPLHLAMNAAALVLFLLRGQFGVVWRAKRDAVAGLPAAWRKRRGIQSARRIGTRQLWPHLDKRLWPLPTSNP